MYALDYVLKGGLAKGKWCVFYDEYQNIYNSEFEKGMALLKSYQFTSFKLFVNCRNTVQIAAFNAKITAIEETVCVKENGEEVEILRYENNQQFLKKY